MWHIWKPKALKCDFLFLFRKSNQKANLRQIQAPLLKLQWLKEVNSQYSQNRQLLARAPPSLPWKALRRSASCWVLCLLEGKCRRRSGRRWSSRRLTFLQTTCLLKTEGELSEWCWVKGPNGQETLLQSRQKKITQGWGFQHLLRYQVQMPLQKSQ